MHAPAQIRLGRGFQPVRAALYYAQRAVTWPRARHLVQHGLATCINWTRPGPRVDDLAETAWERDHLAVLRHDGLVMLDGLVPARQARDMAAYFTARDVVGPPGTGPIGQMPAGTAVAAYSLATSLACPGLIELINHPAVLRLAASYLGCTPTLSSLGVRWSLPVRSGGTNVQRFHRDPDDWRSIKLFVYLTDVDAGSAPHNYVKGSHQTAGTLRARPFGATEVEARFGAGKVVSVTGPAGTCFVADVHGVHRGGVPDHRPRLMLQAQYSILPVYAFRYDPVPLDPPGDIDPYINRLLIRLPGR